LINHFTVFGLARLRDSVADNYENMFVPKAGGRTTRRRQRTSSDDSVNPPKAKRQRSVLRRPDESPSDISLGREIAKLIPSVPNGDSAPTDPSNTDSHIASRAIKQSDAFENNEGTIVLVGSSHLIARCIKLSSSGC
jgi:hypothetical protein